MPQTDSNRIGMGPGRRLPASRRIKRSANFRRAYEHGTKAVGRYMVAWTIPTELGLVRVGVVASKKVGNAVHRNRCKRRLRELFRLHQNEYHATSIDIVIVARASLYHADWDSALNDFKQLMSTLKVTQPNTFHE